MKIQMVDEMEKSGSRTARPEAPTLSLLLAFRFDFDFPTPSTPTLLHLFPFLLSLLPKPLLLSLSFILILSSFPLSSSRHELAALSTGSYPPPLIPLPRPKRLAHPRYMMILIRLT